MGELSSLTDQQEATRSPPRRPDRRVIWINGHSRPNQNARIMVSCASRQGRDHAPHRHRPRMHA
ncbi:hypothetical protein MASSI9I_70157 [Massilia sp. 9I]|nr:hypothetical protein MASSI9I_70157 [Massilia sp. 9I]